ncbi:MAG: hypothetical protein KatS3mg027_1035 [Bacteroidia bacterium]|nr:MAG: hypothetical protein KatS3mg027_1035 [Bacteroidia bacterium]
MKKLSIIIVLISISTSFAQKKRELVSQATVCGQFHKKYCKLDKEKGEKWEYNSQSRSGLFSQGMNSKIRCVIYKGMDYRMTLCAETALGDKLNFKIYDAKTNELLFDNASAENTQVFEFQSATTRPIIIEVFVPEGATESDNSGLKAKDAACLGLLIEHKKTDIQGFSKY